MRRTGFAFCLVCAMAVAAQRGPAAAPQGPLLGERTRFTAGFAEPRGARLHAGIDYSTNRDIGMAVLAPRSGWVSRIAADYGGYGLQLMLTDSTGFRHLFAHLSELRGDLQEELARVQRDSSRYAVAVFPEAGRFPVERGEILARSGATGNGPPHLHYEMRDAREDVALNPLRHGHVLDDDLPPVVEAIVATPLEAGSTVEGGLFPFHLAVRKLGTGLYECPDTLDFEGLAGLSILAPDPVPGTAARPLPWQMDLRSGSDTLFRVSLDAFALDAQAQGARLYDRILQREGGRRYLRLWGGGKRLGFWPGTGDGVLRGDSTGGVRPLEIVVRDAAENVSRVQMRVRGTPTRMRRAAFETPDSLSLSSLLPPPAKPEARKPARGNKGKRRGSRAAAKTPPAPPAEWTLLPVGGGFHLRLAPLPAAAAGLPTPELTGPAGTLPAWGRLRDKGWEWILPAGLVPDGACQLHPPLGLATLELGGFWLEPHEQQVFRDAGGGAPLVLYSDPGTVEARTRMTLHRGTRGTFQLGPAGLALEKPLWLECDLQGHPPESWGKLALFQANAQGAPIALVGGHLAEGRLVAEVARAGRYVLAADTRGPTIALDKPKAVKVKTRVKQRRRWRTRWKTVVPDGYAPDATLSWTIGPDPSGIDRVELRIGGELQFPRYEPDTHRVTFRPTGGWGEGVQRVELRVVDRQGNASDWSDGIRIIAPSK